MQMLLDDLGIRRPGDASLAGTLDQPRCRRAAHRISLERMHRAYAVRKAGAAGGRR
jgi:hypothetical protein